MVISILMEVEHDSGESTGIISEFGHLFMEVFSSFGWESLEGLGHGGHLSDEDEHVLGYVLEEFGWGAGSLVLGALVEDVESWSFESAFAQVLEDLGGIGEVGEVFGETGDVLHGSQWVGNLDESINGLLIEASVNWGVVVLVEGLLESGVVSLETFNGPEHVFFGSGLGINVSDSDGSEGSNGSEFHIG